MERALECAQYGTLCPRTLLASSTVRATRCAAAPEETLRPTCCRWTRHGRPGCPFRCRLSPPATGPISGQRFTFGVSSLRVFVDHLREQLQASLGKAYTLERELGGGGVSRVFIAEATRFARRVVIKVLAPELAAALSVQGFEREIAIVAQLPHSPAEPGLAHAHVGRRGAVQARTTTAGTRWGSISIPTRAVTGACRNDVSSAAQPLPFLPGRRKGGMTGKWADACRTRGVRPRPNIAHGPGQLLATAALLFHGRAVSWLGGQRQTDNEHCQRGFPCDDSLSCGRASPEPPFWSSSTIIVAVSPGLPPNGRS